MLFITIALQAEAKPFISALKLKKNPDIKNFRIYTSPECSLIITGTGPLKSAAATSFLLSSYNAGEEDFFINAGVCGVSCQNIRRGTIFLANRIKDSASGKEMFPDIIFQHPFTEAGLETFPLPASRKLNNTSMIELADMEAAGAFEAATHFIPLHHMAFLKVAVDHLEPESVTPDMIEQVMKRASNNVIAWIKEMGINSYSKKLGDTKKIKEHHTGFPAYSIGRDFNHMDLSKTLEHELESLLHYLSISVKHKKVEAVRIIDKIISNKGNISRRDAKKIVSNLREFVQKVSAAVS